MSEMRDPYQILGVNRSATADEIKKAYRKLAKVHHPDLKPGDARNEERFKEISGAYSLLSDTDKRARFDRGEINADGQEQHAGFGGRRARPGASRPGRQSAEDIYNEDWFSDLFGGSRRGQANRGGGAAGSSGRRGPFWNGDEDDTSGTRGRDINYSVSVSFVEAAAGAKRRVNLSSGKSIDVNIPPGTEDQQKLRLKGQGLANPAGGNPGDAIVEVLVENHPFFTRQDHDIHVEVPVTLYEAVLGASIRVPTISGQVSLRIPAGANTGSTLRLRGKGIPNAKTGTAGDQYVKLKVMLPDPPDSELARFVEEWSRNRSYDVRKKAGLE